MRRRTFLGALGTAALAGRGTGRPTVPRPASRSRFRSRLQSQEAGIPAVMFDSTASLLDAEGRPLTDDSLVPIHAAETASTTDEDGNGDAVAYPEDVPIPVVAVDGGVAGFGAPFVEDDVDFTYGNEEFALNLWDALIGGGTVRWDGGHGQYYTLDRFSGFEAYVERNGYTVEATTSLTANLGEADGVVITSPSRAFTDDETAALASFVDDGGAVVLHHQSDFRNFDETDNLNAVADALEVGFRFNDDQVVDRRTNAGAFYQPTTDRFNTGDFALFASRPSLGFEFDPDETYPATVEGITDGDTVTVQFENGRVDEVRVLGVDTPEVPEAADAERPEEWEGIESRSYLGEWGTRASAFAERELGGAAIEVSVDPRQPTRDPFGRLLAYVRYAPDGGAAVDYSERLIESGHARVFDAGSSRHDALWRIEQEARENGVGVWAASDPDASPPIRNGPVESVFVPTPVPVGTRGGSGLAAGRVPVRAAETASPAAAPLVAVDPDARLAAVGGPVIDERYEAAAGFDVDTSGFGNFPLLTSLLDGLAAADRGGDVYIEGGHRQFNADYALSAEDAAFYQRYLEGVGLGFEQVNDLPDADLSDARALIVSTPATEYTDPELGALAEFADAGGAVVLMGSSRAPDLGVIRLNTIANRLGSDLQFGLVGVRDPESNLAGNPDLPVTGNFDGRFRLFGGYDPESDAGLTLTPSPGPGQTTSTVGATGSTDPGVETGPGQPGFGVLAALGATLGGAALRLVRRGRAGPRDDGDQPGRGRQ